MKMWQIKGVGCTYYVLSKTRRGALDMAAKKGARDGVIVDSWDYQSSENLPF